MTPEELLRALADPERLSVAGALARGPRTVKALADDTAGANLATGDVEKQLNVSAGGKRMCDEQERSADAQLLYVRGVAFSGSLPGH